MAFLVQGGAPPDDSVTTVKIKDDAVTAAKVAAGVLPGKNLLINGDMRIAQRGTSFPEDGHRYTLDRWKCNDNGDGVYTVTQDTDAPTPAQAGTDFKFSLKVDVTTADSSLAAGEEYTVQQRIEGFNMAHLGFGAADAATVTLSFWVKAAKTGSHFVAMVPSAFDRGYSAEYTINVADTWEKKEITVVGDTGGTWVGATNGVGMYLIFVLACGSNKTGGTADTWNTTVEYADTGIVNEMDSTSNNFFLTGVQLEVGSSASDFERRDYASELARCQRYYQESGAGMVAYLHSTTVNSLGLPFPVTMRATPTAVLEDTSPTIQATTAEETGSSSAITFSNLRSTGASFRIDGFTQTSGEVGWVINDTKVFSYSSEL
jgi:hypothetical protein